MRRTPLILILLTLLAMLLVACGGGGEGPTATPVVVKETVVVEVTTEVEKVVESTVVVEKEVVVEREIILLPEVNPLEISGDIISAGSSTVFPLAERMAERFRDEGYAGNITIDSIGSGAGYSRFCEAGETDISNASRAIRDEEVANCNAIGREPIEFRVGTDALAVVVNPENDWLGGGVTLAELAQIFSNEALTWADVNPAWPAEEIKRFTPGTDSGTYDYFIEEVMEPAYGEEAETVFLETGNLQLSEDDNVLVRGVAGDRNGIGFFGFAYYLENADSISALNLDGMEPSEAAVNAGEYPLARPMYMYSDATIMAEKPQVAAFLNFVLTYANEEVLDVGYFPASDEALNGARQAWLNAMGQ